MVPGQFPEHVSGYQKIRKPDSLLPEVTIDDTYFVSSTTNGCSGRNDFIRFDHELYL
jgi:hypothetical protein